MRVDLRQRPFVLIALIGLLATARGRGRGLADRADAAWAPTMARRSRGSKRGRVRRSTRMSSSLGRVARAEAVGAEPVLRQPAEERDVRPLFDRAAELVGRDPAEPLAVTVYGLDGTPLAWAGRPAELTGSPAGGRPTPNSPPPDRFAASPAVFVAPGPLGFRLIWTQPVTAGSDPQPTRLGMVAAERVFSERAAVVNASPDAFSIDTSLGPGDARTRREGAGRARQAVHVPRPHDRRRCARRGDRRPRRRSAAPGSTTAGSSRGWPIPSSH